MGEEQQEPPSPSPSFHRYPASFSSSSFNTDGLFSHSKAEALLRHLLDITNKHEYELSRLNSSAYGDSILSSSFSDSTATDPLATKLDDISRSIDSLTNRIDKIEKQVTIPNITSMTVGEGILTNRRSLARTMQLLATKAEATTLKSFMDDQNSRLLGHETQRREDANDNKSSFRKLSETITALMKRMDVLSHDLSHKIDNSLLKTIQMDVDIIRKHASVVTETSQNSNNVQSTLDDCTTIVSEHSETLSSLSDHVSLLQREINRRPLLDDYTEWESRVRCSLTESLSETMASRGDIHNIRASMNESFHRLSAMESSLRHHCDENEHDASTRRIVDEATERVATDVASLVASTYVTKSYLDNVLEDIREDVGAKAWHRSVVELTRAMEGMERRLVVLAGDHEETKRRAMVAVRFVDWYGRRGDAYETNLKAVDGHLGRTVKRGFIDDGER